MIFETQKRQFVIKQISLRNYNLCSFGISFIHELRVDDLSSLWTGSCELNRISLIQIVRKFDRKKDFKFQMNFSGKYVSRIFW